ncbi:MAG: biopolymer transport protein [Planctomycetota bacterium]|nr:biopolymer transport protein [Planctomycetota bacterium]
MRRRVRGSAPDNFELNLTPLLDVVLQLITFFMMLVHFGTRIEGETRAVRLPVTAAALPAGDLGLDRLVVAVDREGRLLAEDQTRTGQAAASWWTDQAKLRREGRRILGGPGDELPTVVVIRADRDAAYGSVRKTLAQAQATGFAHFSLVVLREERP